MWLVVGCLLTGEWYNTVASNFFVFVVLFKFAINTARLFYLLVQPVKVEL